MSIEIWIAFVLALILLGLSPGPAWASVVTTSLARGFRPAAAMAVGVALADVFFVLLAVFGLVLLAKALGAFFLIVKFAGAVYLIWLGVKLWRARGTLGHVETRRPGGSFFWQGFIVIWSNPKALFFFGAFIPQFIDPSAGAVAQTMLLGVTFMAVATLFDGAYAVLAGHTGALLSRRNVRFVEMISGTCLIGGGLWLALARR